MKTKYFLWVLCLALIVQLPAVIAQNANSTMYWVHEDHVKPSKMMDYEVVAKELAALCNLHQPQNGGWVTLSTIDFRYAYIGQIDSMSDLEKDPFEGMAEKAGKTKMANLWERMDSCYSDHIDYVLHLNNELSYMPEGMNIMPEGEYYRDNAVYYFSPEHMDDAMKLAKDYKELHEEINSKMHYRVYTSGFGADGTYLLIAAGAKDPVHFAEKQMETQKMMGKKGQELQMRFLDLVTRSKDMRGYMRPDLSYIPK